MNKNIVIPLTDSRPIRISSALWPVVAKASEDRDHNNQELFRRHYIRVRLHGRRAKGDGTLPYYGGEKEGAPSLHIHQDQRCIVQAWTESSWQGESGKQAAYVCTLGDVAATIRSAAEEVGIGDDLVFDACADLPPVDVPEDLREWTVEELEAELAARRAA